jgi:type I restriction enzyme S subunit
MSAAHGWETRTLAEFIEFQRGFDLPHRTRRAGPYKVLSSGEAHGWHDEWRVAGPGFVVGRATNIGKPTWSDEDFWPLNTTLFAKDFRGNDPRFAYYWFLGHDLSAYNSGSVQPMLNRNYIANIPIDVPPLAEQRSIGATLSAFDEKIESNQRTSRLINKLATERFRAVILESDCSLVPLGKLTNVVNGRSYKSTELADSATALVTLKSIDRNGGYKVNGLKPYVGEYKFSQVLAPGEIVVAQTDLTQGAEVVGRGVRVPASAEYETLVASLDLAIVRPAEDMPTEYLLGLLTSDDFREWCRSRVTGTTVLHLAKDAISTWPAPLVSPEKQRAFADHASVLYQRLDSLSVETAGLVVLRDAILPELLSGQIRAADLEGEFT